jgi:hypothetical protein
LAENWEVVEYERGDSRFKNPEYETHISHVLLFLFGALTASSQIAMTLEILPGSFWPVTLASFLGGLISFVWIYYAMEHR